VLSPSTLFLVLHVAGTSGCNSTNDVWETVNYTDSPTTAPMVVSIKTTSMTPLYNPSGALTGLVLINPSNNTLYLYADDTFTSPSTLLTNVAGYSVLYDDTGLASQSNAYNGSNVFLTIINTSSTESVYRVTYAGASSFALQYTDTAGGTLGNAVGDSANIYFSDSVNNGIAGAINLQQLPLAGGGQSAVKELYSLAQSGGLTLSLVGSNGSVVVFDIAAGSGGSITSLLETVPVNSPSSSPVLIGQFPGSLSVLMASPTSGVPSDDVLFVNISNEITNGTTPSITYSTEVLSPSNSSIQGLQSNARFLGQATPLSGSVLWISGITDTDGGYGGGTLENVNMNTLAAVPFQMGGANYVIPAGNAAEFIDQSTDISAGALLTSPSGGTTTSGLAVDASQDLIYSVAVANTNVTPAF
jgi:hypothetical protein